MNTLITTIIITTLANMKTMIDTTLAKKMTEITAVTENSTLTRIMTADKINIIINILTIDMINMIDTIIMTNISLANSAKMTITVTTATTITPIINTDGLINESFSKKTKCYSLLKHFYYYFMQ